MTFTVSPWWVVAVLSLALFGVVWWWQWTRDASRDARAWWRDRQDARESGVPVSGFRRLRAWERDRGEKDEGGRIDPPWWWKPWLRLLRAGPLLEDDRIIAGKCEACWAENDGEGCDWAMCGCACHDDALDDLPPERSAEALGFTSPPPESAELRQWRRDEARRERLASAAELEHRAAYEAMGLDYPSGLMARVREAAP